MKVNLCGPAYDTTVTSFNKQKCINWFIEADGAANVAPSKFSAVLLPTPGIVAGKDYGDATVGRASIVYRDKGYVVLSNIFSLVEDDGTPSYIDFLNTSTGDVAVAAGNNGIILADGTNAYFYNLTTTTFNILSDVDLPNNPISCAYYRGIYILAFANSAQLYYSYDTTAWDALDVVSALDSANYVTAVIADHDELWVFGTKSVEVWYATGNPNAPLQPRPNVMMTKGCRAQSTIVSADNTFFWLGTDPSGGYVVVKANGYQPQIISTPAIQAQLATYTTLTDAYAYTHRMGLHEFYVLTFPTENKTWVFDLLSQQWHERASITTQDPTSTSYEPYLKAHRAKNHFFTNNTHWVLDQYTGGINYYDPDVFTELGMPIHRQRRTSALSSDSVVGSPRPIMHDNKFHTYYNLQLNLEPGVALATGQGSDPEVLLSISPDNGFTWHDMDAGKIGTSGDYTGIARWDMLGQARDLVLDFVVTDPIRAIVLGATIDAEKDRF